jgi:hypothetical protein
MVPYLRYSTKSLRNDGTQWFFAVAAFPIPVRSKEFCEKIVEGIFLGNLFTKRAKALFW